MNLAAPSRSLVPVLVPATGQAWRSGRRPRTLRSLPNSPASIPVPPPSAMTARRYPLLRGDAGTAQTIRYMRQAVDGTLPGARQHEGAANPYIRGCALQITRGVRNRDSAGELRAVLDWVRDHIRFRGEKDETIQTPLLTLQLAAGDCDDHAVLLSALLKALGYETRFVTVAADRATNDFSHVFCQARDPQTGEWLSLESTVDDAQPGWAPPDGTIRRRRNWESDSDNHLASARYGR